VKCTSSLLKQPKKLHGRTQKYFWIWVYVEFVPSVESSGVENMERKPVLMAGNEPSQPDKNKLKADEMIVIYLPPTVTSLSAYGPRCH
jgi:hypothetical protein